MYRLCGTGVPFIRIVQKEKQVVFTKNGNNITVDNLSTGEKQIVFRGTYLLRNLKSVAGGTVLIDEPELSLHPKWQEKVLSFYRDIFQPVNKQLAQIIIATHSEYIIQSAFRNIRDSLVIVLKEKEGVINPIKVTAPYVLPEVSLAETNYLAFGIISTDYHNQLFSHLKTKFKLNSIKECDEYIKQHASYNPAIHEERSQHNSTHYETICSFVRNAIHHPESGYEYTQDQLNISINLLIQILKSKKGGEYLRKM